MPGGSSTSAETVGTRDLEARRRVATVFQRPVFFAGTVWDNVRYGLRLRGRTRARRRRQGAADPRAPGDGRLRQGRRAYAVRRGAATGGSGPSLGPGPVDALPGRADEQSRPRGPPRAARRPARHRPPDGHDGGPHHPRSERGLQPGAPYRRRIRGADRPGGDSGRGL